MELVGGLQEQCQCLWDLFGKSLGASPKHAFGILLSSPWGKPANAKASTKGKMPCKHWGGKP